MIDIISTGSDRAERLIHLFWEPEVAAREKAAKEAEAARAAAMMPTNGSYASIALTPGVGSYLNPNPDYSPYGVDPNTPTGPPSKKRRRETAANNDHLQQQRQPDKKSRHKRASRAGSCPATGEASNALPTRHQ
jgi:hypothetical protein